VREKPGVLRDLLIFFRRFSNLKGWTLEDVALLYGVAACRSPSVVLAMACATSARRSSDGGLDVHWGARATRWRA